MDITNNPLPTGDSSPLPDLHSAVETLSNSLTEVTTGIPGDSLGISSGNVQMQGTPASIVVLPSPFYNADGSVAQNPSNPVEADALYQTTFNSLIANLPTNSINALQFYQAFPELQSSAPPDIAEQLEKFEELARNGVIQELGLPEGYVFTSPKAQFEKQMQQNQLVLLNQEIINSPNLSDTEKTEITLLFFHPELQEEYFKNNPELEQKFNAAVQTLNANLNAMYSAPASFTLAANPEFFNNVIKSTVYNELQNQLSSLVTAGTLTQEESNQLQSAFFSMIPSSSLNSKLLPLFNTLKASITASVSSSFSLPSDFDMIFPASFFQAKLDTFFNRALQTALTSASPALSDATKTQYLTAMMNPSDPTIPPFIKQAASVMYNKVLSAFKTSFGLTNFQPTVSPASISFTLPSITNTSLVLSQFVATAQAIFNKMPDSAEKVSMLDYLKVVGETINKLSEMIAFLQTADVQKSSSLGIASNKTSLEKLAAQQKSIQDAAQIPPPQPQSKMSVFISAITKAFTWIAVAIATALIFMVNPVGAVAFATVAVGIMVALEVNEHTGGAVMAAVFGPLMSKDGDSPFVKALKVAVRALILAIPVVALAASGSFGQFMKQTGLIRDIASLAGASPDEIEKIENMVAMVFDILGMVGQMIFMIVTGAGVAALIGEFMGMIARGIATAAAAVLTAVASSSKVVQIAAQAVAKILEFIATIFRTISNMLMGKTLDIIQGLVSDITKSIKSAFKAEELTIKAMANIQKQIAKLQEFVPLALEASKEQIKMAKSFANLGGKAAGTSGDDLTKVAKGLAESRGMIQVASSCAESLATKVTTKGASLAAQAEDDAFELADFIAKMKTLILNLKKLGQLSDEGFAALESTVNSVAKTSTNMKNAAGFILESSLNVVSASTKAGAQGLISQAMSGVIIAGSFAQGIFGIVTGVKTAINETKIGNLIKEKGDYDSLVEILDAMIKGLRKNIDALLDESSDLAEWYSTVATLQTKKFTDANKAIGDLLG